MKVLIDTNVVLDVLLNRSEFFVDSRTIFELVEKKQIFGCITASAITDIFYILKKEIKNIETVYQAIEKIAAIFFIAQVSETSISNALTLRWRDFEDAVQFVAAKENDVTCIITRNKSDYETSDIQCISPIDFIVQINEIKRQIKE